MLDTSTNLHKDIFRLEIIGESLDVASLSETISKIASFGDYWFNRFLKNITHVFSDFSKSEIEDFVRKNRVEMNKILSDPLFTFGGDLYPIPPGMINSYELTVKKLFVILEEIKVDTISSDLSNVLNLKYPIFGYKRSNFDSHSSEIGSLFSKIFIINTSPNKSLIDKESIKSTKDILLEMVTSNFKRVFEIENTITTFEKEYDPTKIPNENRKKIKDRLLSISYRISLFAIVIEHLQEIEHNFVECLKHLKSISKRV